MKALTATSISIALATLIANCSGTDDHELGAGLNRDADSEAPDAGLTVTSSSPGDGARDAGDDEGDGESGTGIRGTAGSGASGGAASGTGGTGATGECAGATTGGNGGDVAPAIDAAAWLQPDSCERSVAYEVRDVRDQNGTALTNYTCQWTFSDGGIENTCAGNKAFGELPGTFYGTAVVRDPATGATTTATSDAVQVIEPQGLEIFVSSDACMQFSYDIDRQYGCGGTHVFDVQPAENVVTPRPWSTSSQTLQVTTPGVYTLEYTVAGCASQYARTCITSEAARVTVEACR
jgi:hypothetical protein